MGSIPSGRSVRGVNCRRTAGGRLTIAVVRRRRLYVLKLMRAMLAMLSHLLWDIGRLACHDYGKRCQHIR